MGGEGSVSGLDPRGGLRWVGGPLPSTESCSSVPLPELLVLDGHKAGRRQWPSERLEGSAAQLPDDNWRFRESGLDLHPLCISFAYDTLPAKPTPLNHSAPAGNGG